MGCVAARNAATGADLPMSDDVRLYKQTEAAVTYPSVAGLSDAAIALDQDALWQRLEQWIAYRWPKREVVWVVAGRGEFMPPLADATVTKTEVAQSGTWETPPWLEIDLMRGPFGVELRGKRYRITADVGSDDDPPAAVLEAYRRLAEYMAEADAKVSKYQPGAFTSYSEGLSDASISVSRPMNHKARAIHYSGAADLLRPWRVA